LPHELYEYQEKKIVPVFAQVRGNKLIEAVNIKFKLWTQNNDFASSDTILYGIGNNAFLVSFSHETFVPGIKHKACMAVFAGKETDEPTQ
jgi:hypothetical protein